MFSKSQNSAMLVTSGGCGHVRGATARGLPQMAMPHDTSTAPPRKRGARLHSSAPTSPAMTTYLPRFRRSKPACSACWSRSSARVPDTYPLTPQRARRRLQPEDEPRADHERDRRRRAGGARHAEGAARWSSRSSGGRVMRYAHNAERVLGAADAVGRAARDADAARTADAPASCASTASACIASPTSRRSRVSCTSSPSARPAPLVVELPRLPGTRETRWTQLLTGAPPSIDVASSATSATTDGRGLAQLAAELDALREEVAALKSAVAALQPPNPQN